MIVLLTHKCPLGWFGKGGEKTSCNTKNSAECSPVWCVNDDNTQISGIVPLIIQIMIARWGKWDRV